MKKEVKFPIAAIISTLNVLIGLINIFFTYSQIGGMPMPAVLNAMVWTILSLVPSILLTVVLFMRKRNLPLFVALGLEFAMNLYGFCSFIGVYSAFLQSASVLAVLGTRAIGVLIWLLLLLFAIFQDRKEESDAASSFRKIWFIPGIVSIIVYLFEGYQIYLGIINHNTTIPNLIAAFSGPMVSIPMAFLLGWWLTHPYKKEKPVCQMPIAQTYGQPIYQSVDTANATQKVFCSGCGQELSPDENFCRVCGKQRTTPAEGAQPVFQQQINPQMGYVQDAPSGGMTALGFFIPIVGLILYLVWKDQTPLKAKSAGKGALIGAIVWTVLSILLGILSVVIPMLIVGSYF